MTAISVSELNRAVSANLERSFPLMRVHGEITQMTRAASGHWYFSLRDANASVKAVMWRARNATLDWQPKEGDQVEVAAVVTLYEPRGDFQLRVESMTRSGQGALFEAFLARKAKLAKQGLMDESRKRPLPDSIGAVALVTSLGAAALRDVVVTLTRLAPRIRIRLYPSLVQGPEAPAMLCQQIAAADADLAVDAVLLVRGGGSLEDLWAFNDEALAIAIAACQHPVICGVGHETDVTIADLVADIRAATPTAAAQMIAHPDQVAIRRLAELAAVKRNAVQRLWARAQQRLDLLAQSLRSPKETLALRRQRLEALSAALRNTIRMRIERTQGLLSRCEAQLVALDPTSILHRGYAMVLDTNGNVVSDAATVQKAELLKVHLSKGLLDVRVEAARPEDKPR